MPVIVARWPAKKSGKTTDSPYAGLVHDGPEYETGTMLGANLMISDLPGILKAIYIADDYGLDIISLGNVIRAKRVEYGINHRRNRT